MLSAGSSCSAVFSFFSSAFAADASVSGFSSFSEADSMLSGLMPHRSSLSSCIRCFSSPCMISFCIWMISSLRSIFLPPIDQAPE